MKKYSFENVDTSGPVNTEECAFALCSAFIALAHAVADGSEEKKEKILDALDQSVANNEGATSYVALAHIAQNTKKILVGEL